MRGIIASIRSRLRRVRKDREEHGGAPEEAEKPIWVTEIGWGVKGNEPEGERSKKTDTTSSSPPKPRRNC